MLPKSLPKRMPDLIIGKEADAQHVILFKVDIHN